MLIIIIYLLVCCVVGIAGRARRPGFSGYVLLSLFLTPIVPLIFLLLTQKRFLEADAAKRSSVMVCRNCESTQMGPSASRHCIHCGARL